MPLWSRREFLRTPTGLAIAAGVTVGEEPQQPLSGGEPLKTIDAHIHVVHTGVPGIPEKVAPDGTRFVDPLAAPAEEVNDLVKAIKSEMEAAGVEHALCMPCWQRGEDDPLGINGTLRLSEGVPGLHAIGIADPTRTEKEHLERVEKILKGGRVKAFKAYLGYLHYGPDSPNYRPYYELAACYDIPFVFHTGDTYSHLAKVKYAHPLLVDEVAVDHPDVRFVLAHVGYPWTIDTGEVVYKNNKKERANVWTDLSGLVVGSAKQFQTYREQGWLDQVAVEIRKVFDYAERPDRFLYASDWPLAPLATYRDFIREAIPAVFHKAVFYDNAMALFKLQGPA